MQSYLCIILPRLILVAFGSDVNGLVNSIDPFLRIISLLDLGVGAVVQSSLYKPIAENDEHQPNSHICQQFLQKNCGGSAGLFCIADDFLSDDRQE